MLAAFAAGTLDHGQHIAIATHLVSCASLPPFCAFDGAGWRCRAGRAFSPQQCRAARLPQVEARLNEPARPAAKQVTPSVPETEVPSTAAIRAPLPLRELEVDRAVRPFAADRAALCEQHTGLPAQVRPRDKDAPAHAHRYRDDVCPFRRVQAGRCPLWTWRFRPGRRDNRSSAGGRAWARLHLSRRDAGGAPV